VVVVEGAINATFVAGTITMLVIGVLLHIVGLGIFCWALFALATYALPLFIGMTAGIYTYQTGAGPFASWASLRAVSYSWPGSGPFFIARSRIVRLIIGLLFAIPAARAGYHVTLTLAHLGIPEEWWRTSFAVLGAIAVGGTAWARVSMQISPALRPRASRSTLRPPNEATTIGG
jgi:hypothetical protein